MTGRWYLAGPMTGIPAFNFPAFDLAAADLRAQGIDIVSPAELDDPETRRLNMASPDGRENGYGPTYADFLARDVRLLGSGDIDGVIVLPGWSRSRGARLETFIIGGLDGKPVLGYPSMEPVHPLMLMVAWADTVLGQLREPVVA
jgi:hypothetical protein